MSVPPRPEVSRHVIGSPMPTCLIVDDDTSQRTLTRMVVEDTGRFRRILEAPDGRDAIRQARAAQPDLVLLDLTMPVLDGLRALPGLRSCSPRSTIIVCSMVQDQAKLHAAKMAGAHGFIDKSLPVDRFVSAVHAAFLQGNRPQPLLAKAR